ncbi:hypothetical protein ACVWW4_005225 [Bradyrhizobium sp. LB7.1]
MTTITSDARIKAERILSAARRRRQLDLLRLGRAALFHADHDLRVRTLFCHRHCAESRYRPIAVGLCDGCRGPRDRADVAAARRHCRCFGPQEAMDRWLRRGAGAGILHAVDRKARRSLHHSAAAHRGRARQRRRGIRHPLQQRDDANPGPAGAARPALRHRLGDRLYRRHRQPDDRARFARQPIPRPAARCSGSRLCSGSIPPAIRATAPPDR